MRKLLLKFILVLLFWVIFGFVVLYVPYPDSITQASVFQLGAFFISLLLAILFSLHLLLKSWVICSIISVGLVLLLILKALNILTFVTLGLTLLASGFLISYFWSSNKPRSGLTPIKSGLTSHTDMPKLTRIRK